MEGLPINNSIVRSEHYINYDIYDKDEEKILKDIMCHLVSIMSVDQLLKLADIRIIDARNLDKIEEILKNSPEPIVSRYMALVNRLKDCKEVLIEARINLNK